MVDPASGVLPRGGNCHELLHLIHWQIEPNFFLWLRIQAWVKIFILVHKASPPRRGGADMGGPCGEWLRAWAVHQQNSKPPCPLWHLEFISWQILLLVPLEKARFTGADRLKILFLRHSCWNWRDLPSKPPPSEGFFIHSKKKGTLKEAEIDPLKGCVSYKGPSTGVSFIILTKPCFSSLLGERFKVLDKLLWIFQIGFS